MSRIAIITPWAPPACGIADHTEKFIAEWGKIHEIHVIAPGKGGSQEIESGGAKITLHRVLDAGKSRIEVIFAEIAPVWTYASFAISAYGTSLLGVKHAIETAGKRGGLVVGYHEPEREPNSLPILGKYIYRNIAKNGVAVAYSVEAAGALEKIGKRKVYYVPHGSATTNPETKSLEQVKERFGQKYVFTFGFVHPDKGLDTLIEAAGLLAARGKRIRVVIAGSVRERRGVFVLNEWRDRRYLKNLQKKAAASGADIEFLGYIPKREIEAHITNAGVIVFSYRSGSQSGAASTALSAGRGAAISEAAGLVRQFEQAGKTHPIGDGGTLALDLEHLLEYGTRDLDEKAVALRSRDGYDRSAAIIEELATGGAGRSGGRATSETYKAG